MKRVRGLAMCAMWMLGCSNDFDPPSLILDLRVLGVASEVVGDIDRTRPLPGETLNVTTVSFAPSATQTFTSAMIACLSPGAPFGGLGPCVGDPLATAVDLEPSRDPPVLTVDIPIDAREIAPDVQVVGILCPQGTPDPDLLGLDQDSLGGDLCLDPAAPGEPFFVQIPIDDGQGNRTPRFSESAVRLEGTEWVTTTTASESCLDAGPEVRRVSRTDAAEVEVGVVGFQEEDRETFIEIGDEPPREIESREALLISNFATAGEFERQFSSIDDEGQEPAIVEWTLPEVEEIPSGGLFVRFFFGVRDGTRRV